MLFFHSGVTLGQNLHDGSLTSMHMLGCKLRRCVHISSRHSRHDIWQTGRDKCESATGDLTAIADLFWQFHF